MLELVDLMSPADHLYINDRPVMLVRAAAARADCSPDHISRLLRQGILDGARTASGWLVDVQSLDAFLTDRAQRKQNNAELIRNLRRSEYEAGHILTA